MNCGCDYAASGVMSPVSLSSESPNMWVVSGHPKYHHLYFSCLKVWVFFISTMSLLNKLYLISTILNIWNIFIIFIIIFILIILMSMSTNSVICVTSVTVCLELLLFFLAGLAFSCLLVSFVECQIWWILPCCLLAIVIFLEIFLRLFLRLTEIIWSFWNLILSLVRQDQSSLLAPLPRQDSSGSLCFMRIFWLVRTQSTQSCMSPRDCPACFLRWFFLRFVSSPFLHVRVLIRTQLKTQEEP